MKRFSAHTISAVALALVLVCGSTSFAAGASGSHGAGAAGGIRGFHPMFHPVAPMQRQSSYPNLNDNRSHENIQRNFQNHNQLLREKMEHKHHDFHHFHQRLIGDPGIVYGGWVADGVLPVDAAGPVVVEGGSSPAMQAVVPTAAPRTASGIGIVKIRSLDGGNPAKQLGQSYRVWLRNDGDADINQGFDVALVAGNVRKLGPKLPYGGVRVDGLSAGETLSVDIRLPYRAMTMGRDNDGKPAPFAYLFAVVDSQAELGASSENHVHLECRQDIPTLPVAESTETRLSAAGSNAIPVADPKPLAQLVAKPIAAQSHASNLDRARSALYLAKCFAQGNQPDKVRQFAQKAIDLAPGSSIATDAQTLLQSTN